MAVQMSTPRPRRPHPHSARGVNPQPPLVLSQVNPCNIFRALPSLRRPPSYGGGLLESSPRIVRERRSDRTKHDPQTYEGVRSAGQSFVRFVRSVRRHDRLSVRRHDQSVRSHDQPSVRSHDQQARFPSSPGLRTVDHGFVRSNTFLILFRTPFVRGLRIYLKPLRMRPIGPDSAPRKQADRA